MCVLLVTTWSENHGDASAPISQSFISAWGSIKSGRAKEKTAGGMSVFAFFCLDKKVFLLGIVQALFEGSMYIFVLEWTPALTQALNKTVVKTDNKNPPIPHGKSGGKERFLSRFSCFSGYVFASYMVAMMMGSNSFKVLCNYATPESFMR